VQHQIFKQPEFPVLQQYWSAGAYDLVRQKIDAQVADRERCPNRRALALEAPYQRFEARQQLAKRKRLGQIVVTPRAQAFDSVVDFAESAEDQDRCLVADLRRRYT
jgi:hypothetical protein